MNSLCFKVLIFFVVCKCESVGWLLWKSDHQFTLHIDTGIFRWVGYLVASLRITFHWKFRWWEHINLLDGFVDTDLRLSENSKVAREPRGERKRLGKTQEVVKRVDVFFLIAWIHSLLVRAWFRVIFHITAKFTFIIKFVSYCALALNDFWLLDTVSMLQWLTGVPIVCLRYHAYLMVVYIQMCFFNKWMKGFNQRTV